MLEWLYIVQISKSYRIKDRHHSLEAVYRKTAVKRLFFHYYSFNMDILITS